MSANDWFALLSIAIGLALMAFNRPVARWAAPPPWRPGSRGAQFEEDYRRRYPGAARLYGKEPRLGVGRLIAVVFGAAFVYLGVAALAGWY